MYNSTLVRSVVGVYLCLSVLSGSGWADEDVKGERQARLKADLVAVQQYRGGLEKVVAFADSRPDLFPTNRISGIHVLTREQREEVWTAWKTFLDYSIALDSVRRDHDKTFLIIDRQVRDGTFLVSYAAFLAQYRFSLEFIKLVENDPGLAVLLNDSVPELGLEKGTFSRFKFFVINLARGAEYMAFKSIWATTLKKPDLSLVNIEEDVSVIDKGRVKDQLLAFDNAFEIVCKGGSTAWFPVQKGVSIWMGDTKVWRKNGCLITADQLGVAVKRLLPGDILLERREWYMSNVGLPGFWPHAVIYVGTPEDRKAFFNDAETRDWVKGQGQSDGDFESLLKSKYPDVYAQSVAVLEEGHVPRVLEAIGEGVVFTTFEHSGAADSLCALRPRLTRKELAVALFRSLHYVGRPYDFNFDFATDSAIVCTELVFKSYQACPDSRGLSLPVLNILGRPATPANELVHQFDLSYDTTNQQFDLVFFLDGNEKTKKAAEGSMDGFRKSWRRPKWHVITQGRKDEETVKAAGLKGDQM